MGPVKREIIKRKLRKDAEAEREEQKRRPSGGGGPEALGGLAAASRLGDDGMLTIALQRIEFDGRHGATAVERRSTRKFEVDVELEVDAAVAEQSDLLADTVDYSKRRRGDRRASATGEPHHLLESLARRMLEAVRERFPRVRRIQIELRKLNPPTCPGHPAYAAVRIVRGDA